MAGTRRGRTGGSGGEDTGSGGPAPSDLPVSLVSSAVSARIKFGRARVFGGLTTTTTMLAHPTFRLLARSRTRAFSSSAPASMAKVAVLGAGGGIGQPLSLLLKRDPLVSALSLYDIRGAPGVAADVGHIDTPSEVRDQRWLRPRAIVDGRSHPVLDLGARFRRRQARRGAPRCPGRRRPCWRPSQGTYSSSLYTLPPLTALFPAWREYLAVLDSVML